MSDPSNHQPPSPPQLQPTLHLPVSLARAVGYGLLVLTIFNIADLLIPISLMQPVWELQTIGALVESVPIPLLSLALIFYQGNTSRWKSESLLLKIISWLSLVWGAVLLMLIPLIVSNTIRLNAQASERVSSDYSIQVTQIERFQDQLKSATSEDLNGFLASQGISLDGQDLQQVKDEVSKRLAESRKQIQTQYEAERANRRNSLLKNAVKCISGALVSGFIFMYIWRQTTSTHKPIKRRLKKA
jgi:hypothetical protein